MVAAQTRLKRRAVVGCPGNADAQKVGAFVHGQPQARTDQFDLKNFRRFTQQFQLLRVAELGL